MKIENNFISIVMIGSFNPAILVPDFLKKHCKVKFNSEPKFQSVPNMVSDIQVDNLKFLMDISRFQINEKKVINFKNSEILRIACLYLKVLKYTPITKIGFNFNIKIQINNKKSILKRILNDSEFVKYFDSKTLHYQLNKIVEKKLGSKFDSLKVSVPLENNNNINIHIRDINSEFIINYNYELNKDNFLEVCKENSVDVIEKEFLKTIKYFMGD